MWEAYRETVLSSPLDWLILSFGVALIAAQAIGIVMRFHGKRVLFVQHLEHYRTFCLLLTELLPVLGLLETALSLMYTFKSFQGGSGGQEPDLAQMIHSFSPAISGTISGLLMVVPNLLLNGVMWLACAPAEKGGQ
jgi:hypothetical protein